MGLCCWSCPTKSGQMHLVYQGLGEVRFSSVCAVPSLCVKWWDFSPLLSASPNIVTLRNFSIPMGWWILWINLRMLLSQLIKLLVFVWTRTGTMHMEIWAMLWTSHSFLSFEFEKHSFIKKTNKPDLSVTTFSNLMKLRNCYGYLMLSLRSYLLVTCYSFRMPVYSSLSVGYVLIFTSP